MFRKSWLCEHRGPDLSSGLSNEGQLPDAEFSGLLMDSGSSIWEEETNKYPKWMTGTSKLFLLRCCWGKEPGGCICVLVHLLFFLYDFKHTAVLLSNPEGTYLVHALRNKLSLAVDACERAVPRHLLQRVRNISRRRGAAICRMGTCEI